MNSVTSWIFENLVLSSWMAAITFAILLYLKDLVRLIKVLPTEIKLAWYEDVSKIPTFRAADTDYQTTVKKINEASLVVLVVWVVLMIFLGLLDMLLK